MNIAPTRTLLLVNLLALAGLAYLWVDRSGNLRHITWIPPAPVKAVIAAASMPAESTSSIDTVTFAATLERPLFAPDRRPPSPVLPPPPPDPLANVQLVGLFSGEVSGVLIRLEGRVRQVSLNQKVGDWTLQAIEDRSVTFAKANETRVIRLEYARLNVPVPAVAIKAPVAAGGPAGLPAQAADASRRLEDEAKERIREQMRARMKQK